MKKSHTKSATDPLMLHGHRKQASASIFKLDILSRTHFSRNLQNTGEKLRNI